MVTKIWAMVEKEDIKGSIISLAELLDSLNYYEIELSLKKK